LRDKALVNDDLLIVAWERSSFKVKAFKLKEYFAVTKKGIEDVQTEE